MKLQVIYLKEPRRVCGMILMPSPSIPNSPIGQTLFVKPCLTIRNIFTLKFRTHVHKSLTILV